MTRDRRGVFPRRPLASARYVHPTGPTGQGTTPIEPRARYMPILWGFRKRERILTVL